MNDAKRGERYTRWVAGRKSAACALMMFGTNVCGLRSTVAPGHRKVLGQRRRLPRYSIRTILHQPLIIDEPLPA